MNLFQHVSVWSLRALVLWGAVEFASASYDVGSERFAAWARLAGHRAAMTRLDERARTVEAAAAAAEARLTPLSGHALAIAPNAGEAPTRAAERTLRDVLLSLGAQAPVVEANEIAGSGGRLGVTARWREPSETAPQVLHGLAARFPDLDVEALTLERADLVRVEARFQTSVRLEAPSVAR